MAGPIESWLLAFTSLLKFDRTRAPGPAPTNDSAHVLLAPWTIGDAGVLGRHALSSEVGLGEGAIRTVMKWLKADDYITIEASRCRLTARGKRAHTELRKLMPKMLVLPQTPLTV